VQVGRQALVLGRRSYRRSAAPILRPFFLSLLLAFLVLGTGLCSTAPRPVVLATTTSTQDTGLLDALVPRFEKETGLTVKVIAVGTGQALELGRRGDADVLLVHAPAAEQQFVAEGHGIERRPVFYNDFVLLGPAADPAGVRSTRSITAALKGIAGARATFISRGDDSGTHKKEQALWKEAGVTPSGGWYRSAGAGMAEALRMGSELGAYTLSDRGTYLALARTLHLSVLFEGGAALQNPYAVIVVNPRQHPGVNVAGARRFAAYLLRPATMRWISTFGKDRYGQPLFHPFSLPDAGEPRRK
jgi:tungstate transport system substrate-binding protein